MGEWYRKLIIKCLRSKKESRNSKKKQLFRNVFEKKKTAETFESGLKLTYIF